MADAKEKCRYERKVEQRPLSASRQGLQERLQRERIEKLKKEQGEKPTGEHIVGIGRDLWKNDEEFAEFMRILRDLRK